MKQQQKLNLLQSNTLIAYSGLEENLYQFIQLILETMYYETSVLSVVHKSIIVSHPIKLL